MNTLISLIIVSMIALGPCEKGPCENVKKIEVTETGMLITYADGTGYYIGE